MPSAISLTQSLKRPRDSNAPEPPVVPDRKRSRVVKSSTADQLQTATPQILLDHVLKIEDNLWDTIKQLEASKTQNLELQASLRHEEALTAHLTSALHESNEDLAAAKRDMEEKLKTIGNGDSNQPPKPNKKERSLDFYQKMSHDNLALRTKHNDTRFRQEVDRLQTSIENLEKELSTERSLKESLDLRNDQVAEFATEKQWQLAKLEFRLEKLGGIDQVEKNVAEKAQAELNRKTALNNVSKLSKELRNQERVRRELEADIADLRAQLARDAPDALTLRFMEDFDLPMVPGMKLM
ncbi:hypothetical protein D6D19_05835 [Aureobasidium pullulans]|uniref:Uncharacterized protein n=1 Tax=Aureobasidium pullulans TaxID=5580 RepID=A0A4S9A2M5_AURPU|nr:hypothetical protein D6D19_05835 [Aureobasidium pullulans]